MATAYVARKLNIPATIIVPSSSPELIREKLKDQGATVRVVGKVIPPISDHLSSLVFSSLITKDCFTCGLCRLLCSPRCLLPFVCLIFPVQVWDDANDEALRLTQTDGLTYVPPFDHPLLW